MVRSVSPILERRDISADEMPNFAFASNILSSHMIVMSFRYDTVVVDLDEGVLKCDIGACCIGEYADV